MLTMFIIALGLALSMVGTAALLDAQDYQSWRREYLKTL